MNTDGWMDHDHGMENEIMNTVTMRRIMFTNGNAKDHEYAARTDLCRQSSWQTGRVGSELLAMQMRLMLQNKNMR